MTDTDAIEAYDLALEPETTYKRHTAEIILSDGRIIRALCAGNSNEIIQDCFYRNNLGRLKGRAYQGTTVKSITILD